ncbi:MAG: hypothetical protein ACE145_21165 [Terriglobia bacterium]
MNEDDVLAAVNAAEKLVSKVKGDSLRAAAFGVVLARVLDKRVTLGSRPQGGAVHRAEPGSGRKQKKLGPQDRIQELVDDGFYKSSQSLNSTQAELSTRGYSSYSDAVVGKALQRLVRARVLRRSKSKEGKRSVYVYANW